MEALSPLTSLTALRAFNALQPLESLRALRALRTLDTLSAVPRDSLQALEALPTLCPLSALSALHPLSAIARNPLQPLEPLAALRTLASLDALQAVNAIYTLEALIALRTRTATIGTLKALEALSASCAASSAIQTLEALEALTAGTATRVTLEPLEPLRASPTQRGVAAVVIVTNRVVQRLGNLHPARSRLLRQLLRPNEPADDAAARDRLTKPARQTRLVVLDLNGDGRARTHKNDGSDYPAVHHADEGARVLVEHQVVNLNVCRTPAGTAGILNRPDELVDAAAHIGDADYLEPRLEERIAHRSPLERQPNVRGR